MRESREAIAAHVGAEGVRGPSVKPFLKWTGGKQWLGPFASRMVPAGFAGTYYEPFYERDNAAARMR